MRQRVASAMLAVYKRVLGPVLNVLFPSQCKYLPTCSDYAYAAVVRYGWVRGGWMAVKRVGRCHPWATGGHDPVP